MKGILIFKLPEENQEFEDAQKGWKYKDTINEIWNRVFRPRHKHGYSNPSINLMLEDEKCQQLMDLLEEEYREVIHEN